MLLKILLSVPEINQAVKALIPADNHKIRIRIAARHHAANGRKLKVQIIFTGIQTLEVLNSHLAVCQQRHGINRQALCRIAVEQAHAVLLPQLVKSLQTAFMYIFIINKINRHTSPIRTAWVLNKKQLSRDHFIFVRKASEKACRKRNRHNRG